MSKSIYINDSIHGLIQLSEYEKRIVSSIGFNRLHDVYQNSTVYLTFPSNRTKRFEHSLGTMKIASDMFFRSIVNTTDTYILEQFYSKFKNKILEVIELIKSDNSLCEVKLAGKRPSIKDLKELNLEMDQMRNSLVPSNVPECYIEVHCIIIESVRIVALMHDVGHPPFSHIVENALHNQYEKHVKKMNKNSRTQIFCETMNKYFKEEKKLHEEMGDEICSNILGKTICTMSYNQYDKNKYLKNLYELIVSECVLRILKNEDTFEDLHAIVDGALDSDRLDYVTRDSLNSGINSGKIEYQRIINDMKLLIRNGKFIFCVPQKAVNSVEDFIKRRLTMYKNIIYHHRVIKTDSLLQSSVEKMIENYLADNILDNNNNKDNVIPYDISGLWFPLQDTTPTEKENALSQWNDSWLITVLKQFYYSKYYQSDNYADSSEYVLAQQLAELLCNTKKYSSLIKRRDDFLNIDVEFKRELKERGAEIQKLIDVVQSLSQNNVDDSLGKTLDISPTLDVIQRLINYPDNDNLLALRYAIKKSDAFSTEIPDMNAFVEKRIKEIIEKHFTKANICDIMVISKRLTSGLNGFMYFYAPHDDSISILADNSQIPDIVDIEVESFPAFYIYLLLKENVQFDDKKRKDLLKEIGKEIATSIADNIVIFLSNNKVEMEKEKCAK